MRVLHVIGSIGPARGGPSAVIRTLAQAQAAQGAQVHVASTDDDGPDRRTPPSSVPFTDRGVTYWLFPRQTRFYLFSWPLTRWLLKHAREYDVIHIHALFNYVTVAAAFAATRSHTPYVLRPLGTLSTWSMRNRRRWVKRLSFRWIESRIVKSAAAVQYTCEQESVEARGLGIAHRAVVIPNPVQMQPTSAGSRRCKKLVLFLSRLDRKKGLDLLLPAFAEVRKQIPDAKLVIAGSGEPTFVDEMKRLSESLGLGSSIDWAGFLEGERKSAAFENATIFVLPSYSENFGVSVVEAMAAGLPVVVSDQVGIHHEIDSAGAGRITPCDSAPLARAIVEMLLDDAGRDHMGKNAVKLARGFAPVTIAKQLESLYGTIA